MTEIATPAGGTEKEQEITEIGDFPGLERMLFSVAEVASVLCISTTTVRALTHQGDLRCVTIGKRMLYRRVDVESFVESLVEH